MRTDFYTYTRFSVAYQDFNLKYFNAFVVRILVVIIKRTSFDIPTCQRTRPCNMLSLCIKECKPDFFLKKVFLIIIEKLTKTIRQIRTLYGCWKTVRARFILSLVYFQIENVSIYPPSIIQLLKNTIKREFYIFFIRNT